MLKHDCTDRFLTSTHGRLHSPDRTLYPPLIGRHHHIISLIIVLEESSTRHVLHHTTLLDTHESPLRRPRIARPVPTVSAVRVPLYHLDAAPGSVFFSRRCHSPFFMLYNTLYRPRYAKDQSTIQTALCEGTSYSTRFHTYQHH